MSTGIMRIAFGLNGADVNNYLPIFCLESFPFFFGFVAINRTQQVIHASCDGSVEILSNGVGR